MNMASMEAYADRQLQRYDRRLLKVRARQALWRSHEPTRSLWLTQAVIGDLDRLAKRIIRKRDAFMVQCIAILDPVHYR